MIFRLITKKIKIDEEEKEEELALEMIEEDHQNPLELTKAKTENVHGKRRRKFTNTESTSFRRSNVRKR